MFDDEIKLLQICCPTGMPWVEFALRANVFQRVMIYVKDKFSMDQVRVSMFNGLNQGIKFHVIC